MAAMGVYTMYAVADRAVRVGRGWQAGGGAHMRLAADCKGGGLTTTLPSRNSLFDAGVPWDVTWEHASSSWVGTYKRIDGKG